MAAAAPSPLSSSVEKTNGAKLSRLLIDGGTTVLRNVFDGFHPPVNLAADLNANYLTLHNLFKRKVLHKPQWDQLFPPGGATPDSKTFDITLLFLLLTNICGLSPPPSGWHKPPPSSDNSLEANLSRIKLYRNALYGHVTSTGVQTAVFNAKWKEMSAVLVALGLNPAEVVKIQSAPCGEDYISAVIEWAKSDKEIKSQLREVLKLQQKDHRTLQDTRQAVEDVQQMHKNTHQVVEEVLKTQQQARQTQQEVMKTQKENLATLQQVKETVENMKERSDKDKEDEILGKLAEVNSQKVIEHHAERYQERTRLSFFERVEKWLGDRSSPNRVMVISGNAGMGKSVIAAVICRRMQEAGRLSGSHFCQHNKVRYRNPKIMLQSLACQLSYSLPEYKNALVETLSRNLGVELNNMEVNDLFELLFEELLSKLEDPGRNILMVIDGLDESEYQGRNELLDVIANHFIKLPCWIRFLVTTRPEINIADSLKRFKPLQLEPNNEENLMDLRLLFERRLSDVIQQDLQEVIITELVKMSEGLILCAYLLVHFIKENVSLLTPEQLDSTLPSGISSVYQTYFKRLETELCKELKIKEEQFLFFLSALTAAREPLLIDFVSKTMLSGSSSLADRRKLKKVVACISTLLPVRDDCIHFFHKSVKDWLTDTSLYGQHDFTVDEREGHRILSELCTNELDDIKREGVGSAQFSDTAKYALKHGVQHILHLEDDARACEVVIEKYVVDLELVYAKLFVSNAKASEDILWIQKQEISQVLSEDIKCRLKSLIFCLRKYLNTVTDHPCNFFQTVLSYGGSVLSPMASNLLQNKYPEMPYMEYVRKDTQQSAVQARFQCSSQVACLDVSPQLDYMVCECRDGTIELWSPHIGRPVWVRPVLIEKHYFYKNEAYRISSSSSCTLSCYRSVIFHPTEDLILPGVLSKAYTFSGDLKPLFTQSSCSFTVCSISGDKTTMLTDCPDDAKCIIMWSLKNGLEIARTTRNDDVLSFAWSRDGRLLAMSFSSGSVNFVDVMDGFATLAEMAVPEPCGMIKFSFDSQSLFCFRVAHTNHNSTISAHFCLNISMAEHSSCTLYIYDKVVPWQFESRNEPGFLLGDPISSEDVAFHFVVNKETVLRGYPNRSFIDILTINDLQKTVRKATPSGIRKIVFSLNGGTVYVVRNAEPPTVTAWDISSGKPIAKKNITDTSWRGDTPTLTAVETGVFLERRKKLALWNSNLSEVLHVHLTSYPLNEVMKLVPISEDLMVYVTNWSGTGNTVTVQNSAKCQMSKRIGCRQFVAINSKYWLLTCSRSSFQLFCNGTTLWTSNLYPPSYKTPLGMFSPAERFVVIYAAFVNGEKGMCVLDAASGEKLHTLCKGGEFSDCKFVSDEECVISCHPELEDCSLLLCNIKSGDVLSVIDLETEVTCLAACPCQGLVAFDQRDAKRGFELIQVHLPQDNDSRKINRTVNASENNSERTVNASENNSERFRFRCTCVLV